MSTTSPPPPPWARWYDVPRHSPAGANMRVSDAERAAVGEVLTKHYADGRLDDEEFKERLDRAMSAKTRADLSGLTTDLPSDEQAPPPPVPRRHSWHVVLAVVAAIVIAGAVAPLFTPWHFPWLLVAVVAVILWRRNAWHHHHDRYGPSRAAPPPFP